MEESPTNSDREGDGSGGGDISGPPTWPPTWPERGGVGDPPYFWTATPERPSGTPERPSGTPERPSGTPERPSGTPDHPVASGTPDHPVASGTPETPGAAGTTPADLARRQRVTAANALDRAGGLGPFNELWKLRNPDAEASPFPVIRFGAYSGETSGENFQREVQKTVGFWDDENGMSDEKRDAVMSKLQDIIFIMDTSPEEMEIISELYKIIQSLEGETSFDADREDIKEEWEKICIEMCKDKFKEAVNSVNQLMMEICPIPFQGSTASFANRYYDTWSCRFGEFSKTRTWEGINPSKTQYNKTDMALSYIDGETYDKLAQKYVEMFTNTIIEYEKCIKTWLGFFPGGGAADGIELLEKEVQKLCGGGVLKHGSALKETIRKFKGMSSEQKQTKRTKVFNYLWPELKKAKKIVEKQELQKRLKEETMIKFLPVYIPLVENRIGGGRAGEEEGRGGGGALPPGEGRRTASGEEGDILIPIYSGYERARNKEEAKERFNVKKVKEIIKCAFPFYIKRSGEKILAVDITSIEKYVESRKQQRLEDVREPVRRESESESTRRDLSGLFGKVSLDEGAGGGGGGGEPTTREHENQELKELEQRIYLAMDRAGVTDAKLGKVAREFSMAAQRNAAKEARRLGEAKINVWRPKSTVEERLPPSASPPPPTFRQKVFIF